MSTGDMHGKCKKHMNYHVLMQTKDGNLMDGIIEEVDEHQVTMLVPEEVAGGEQGESVPQERQNGYGGGYGFRPRYRRYRRRSFPLVDLISLYLYPYYYPHYPYYYPRPYPYYL